MYLHYISCKHPVYLPYMLYLPEEREIKLVRYYPKFAVQLSALLARRAARGCTRGRD